MDRLEDCVNDMHTSKRNIFKIMRSGDHNKYTPQCTPWNRRKIMLIGEEGKVGKTAFGNSILGDPFVQVDSTVRVRLMYLFLLCTLLVVALMLYFL